MEKKKSVLINQNACVTYLCKDTKTFSYEKFPFILDDFKKKFALDEKGQIIKEITGYMAIGSQGISKKDIPFSTDQYNVC